MLLTCSFLHVLHHVASPLHHGLLALAANTTFRHFDSIATWSILFQQQVKSEVIPFPIKEKSLASVNVIIALLPCWRDMVCSLTSYFLALSFLS